MELLCQTLQIGESQAEALLGSACRGSMILRRDFARTRRGAGHSWGRVHRRLVIHSHQLRARPPRPLYLAHARRDATQTERTTSVRTLWLTLTHPPSPARRRREILCKLHTVLGTYATIRTLSYTSTARANKDLLARASETPCLRARPPRALYTRKSSALPGANVDG